MTTIVYHQGIIAADSRVASGDIITDDNYNKIINKNGVVFAFSGATTDQQDLINAYFGEPYQDKLEIDAIIVDKGVVYVASTDEENKFWKLDITERSYCIGAGRRHAWTAIDCGCNAKQAVEMAIKRDIYSGGKVTIHKVKRITEKVKK